VTQEMELAVAGYVASVQEQAAADLAASAATEVARKAERRQTDAKYAVDQAARLLRLAAVGRAVAVNGALVETPLSMTKESPHG